MLKKRLLLFVIALSTGIAVTFAQGTIKGIVSDKDGVPLAHAYVFIKPNYWFRTYSNSKGEYTFSYFPAGIYKVVAKESKYASEYIQLNVKIDSNEVKIIDLRICEPPDFSQDLIYGRDIFNPFKIETSVTLYGSEIRRMAGVR